MLSVVYFLTFPRGAIIDRDGEFLLFFALNTVIGIAVSYAFRCTSAAACVLYPAMFCGLAFALVGFFGLKPRHVVSLQGVAPVRASVALHQTTVCDTGRVSELPMHFLKR